MPYCAIVTIFGVVEIFRTSVLAHSGCDFITSAILCAKAHFKLVNGSQNFESNGLISGPCASMPGQLLRAGFFLPSMAIANFVATGLCCAHGAGCGFLLTSTVQQIQWRV